MGEKIDVERLDVEGRCVLNRLTRGRASLLDIARGFMEACLMMGHERFVVGASGLPRYDFKAHGRLIEPIEGEACFHGPQKHRVCASGVAKLGEGDLGGVKELKRLIVAPVSQVDPTGSEAATCGFKGKSVF